MLKITDIVNNQTICDLFGVANTGGIRVNRNRNLIVLISNNTDPAYKNEWRDDLLHFVGGGPGNQMLTRQNRTLANSTKNNAVLHLFEVFQEKQYVYAGLVQLAAEPYEAEQIEKSGERRTVWVFPLKKRADEPVTETKPPVQVYLPYGAYAVISDNLTDEQRDLVHVKLDELKAAGVPVIDKREVFEERYGKKLGKWSEAALAKMQSLVKARIAELKKQLKASGKSFDFEPDEIAIDAYSDERRILEVLDCIGIPDEFDVLKAKAFDSVEMPSAHQLIETSEEAISLMKPINRRLKYDPQKFKDVT